MTIKSVEEQVAIIKEATARAASSAEAASEFLREAGIIKGKVLSRNKFKDQFTPVLPSKKVK